MSDSIMSRPGVEYVDRRLWEWTKLEDGGAVITGYNGEQSDVVVPAVIDGHTIEIIEKLEKSGEKNTTIRSVTLPDTVVEIAAGAFENMDVLERVNLSASLKYIGDSAFRNCTRLKSIEFPDSLEIVENSAFLDCTSLKKAVLPDSLRVLGDGSFCRCINLEEAHIPDSLEYMGRAFCDCKRLEDQDGFVIVGGVLYNYYGYRPDVVIPEGVREIDNNVFCGNKRIISVMLPGTLTHIGSYAFDGAANLHTVVLPESLQTIGRCAFRNCMSLEGINIPKGLHRMQECAFQGCYNLVDRDGFIVVGGVLFDYIGNRTDVVVPDGVIRISDKVFEGRSDITSMKLPVSAREMDHYTFRGCRGLADKDGYIVINGVLYDYIGDETYLTIPEGVREIKNLSIPKDRVTSVKLPTTLQRVDGFTFNGCHRLADNNGFIIMNGVLYGYMGYSYDVIVPYGVTEINDDAFNSCKNMRSVQLPDSVKKIGEGAFFNCVGLESITLGSVRYIGREAFGGCYKLKTAEPDASADVEDTAFVGCSALADENGFVVLNGMLYDYIPGEAAEVVTVPGSVKAIGGRLMGFQPGANRPHPLRRCRVIRAKKGSCMQEFAREKGIAFEEI